MTVWRIGRWLMGGRLDGVKISTVIDQGGKDEQQKTKEAMTMSRKIKPHEGLVAKMGLIPSGDISSPTRALHTSVTASSLMLIAQVSLPPGLFERKKDQLPEAHSPLRFRIIDANEALNGFKYDKTGSSTVPLAVVVACVVEQPPYKVEHAATSGKCIEHKLRRQKGYTNLRIDGAV
ncbi:hypothetical protein KCU64_g15, partial [Aureobasidium melanogenum]